MAHRVVWSRRALADVEAIATYISQDSPAYARTIVRNIVASTRVLEEFPRSGRKVPELDDDKIRELIAYSYRIIYRIEESQIIVAAVVHGKQMLTP